MKYLPVKGVLPIVPVRGELVKSTVWMSRAMAWRLVESSSKSSIMPGETYDHLTVWLPQIRAAFVGDNLYGSFPNMYTLRGWIVRSLRFVSPASGLMSVGVGAVLGTV